MTLARPAPPHPGPVPFGEREKKKSCPALPSEMHSEERKDLVPAVCCLLGPVGDTHGIEEGVAAAVIAVELVFLAELLEHRFRAVDVVAARILVVVAENAEHWACDVRGQVDRRDWL